MTNLRSCGLVLLTLFAPLTQIHAQVATTTTGIAVFEAEQFSNSIPRSSREWEMHTERPGYSAAGYVVVTNSNVSNSNINDNVTTTSPELQYGVIFNQLGTYQVWARGYGDDGTEDSVHVGLDGILTGSGSNLTWAPVSNTWTWTNGANKTISVTSTGLHTFNLWMREDGSRVDRFVLTTSTIFRAILGEAFHIPSIADVNLGGHQMRQPLHAIFSNTAVFVYNGNQDTGPGGNPGNQLQTGSIVYYRNATSTTWLATNMTFFVEGPSGFGSNNKYYRSVIPANMFRPGDVVQYYLRIAYNTHLPTYLYGNDNLSLKSEFESIAQTDPFSFTVQWPLQPEGDYLAIAGAIPAGAIEARIYTNSGHLSFVGPDLAGNPMAATNHIAPPAARVNGELHTLGAVIEATAISNGLALVQRLSTTTVHTRLTFMAEGVARFEVADWGGLIPSQSVVTAPSGPDEQFFGFGEKFNTVNQAGKSVHMITDDPPGNKGDRSYKVMPWFISTRGYGFHFDSSAESFFNMRAGAADRYVVSNQFGALKFNIIFGPELTNVLIRFTGYTGRPPLSPPWAFAPWISSDIWRSGGEVRFLLTKLREFGLPHAAVVFDSPWETSYNDFTWNMTQWGIGFTNSSFLGQPSATWAGFSSVSDMMTFIRSNGFKVICWMTPFINTNSFVEHTGIYGGAGVPGQNLGKSANYDTGAINNYFVRASSNGPPLISQWWKGRGSPVDFTNPDATRWLQGQLSNLVAQSGGVIGGFKTDDGESGNPPGSYIPTSCVFSDGRTGLEMQNGYATEYHKAVWHVLGTNGILFARSGFTGSQAYPGYWAGDNEPNFGHENGLSSVVVAGLSAAMSGYSIWSHDVGGYQDSNFSSTPTNLFMRWTQFGAFTPLMQMHRQTGAGVQYPWSRGADGLTNYHYYTRFHMALFPYIYSYAKESSINGMPIMRPPALMHPSDTNTYGINHTYYFGNELLIAAMITNMATSRIVYLPHDAWYDYWTRATYSGGQNITWTNADQMKYPIFVRKGAIIPLIASNVQTLVDASYIGHTNLVTWDGSLEFMVFPSSNGSFTVYDGTTAQCHTNQTVTRFTLNSAPRGILLRVYNPISPGGVERNGVRLPRYTNDSAFASADLGWLYDAPSQFALVKWSHSGGAAEIAMGPDSLGDGIPDSWRQTHFGDALTTNSHSCAGCDPDTDKMSNWEEYRAGTDPNSTASTLKMLNAVLVPVPADNVRVTWSSQPGIPYRLQKKEDMSDPAQWQMITNEFTGDGTILDWLDDATPTNNPDGQRYFRLVVP